MVPTDFGKVADFKWTDPFRFPQIIKDIQFPPLVDNILVSYYYLYFTLEVSLFVPLVEAVS